MVATAPLPPRQSRQDNAVHAAALQVEVTIPSLLLLLAATIVAPVFHSVVTLSGQHSHEHESIQKMMPSDAVCRQLLWSSWALAYLPVLLVPTAIWGCALRGDSCRRSCSCGVLPRLTVHAEPPTKPLVTSFVPDEHPSPAGIFMALGCPAAAIVIAAVAVHVQAKGIARADRATRTIVRYLRRSRRARSVLRGEPLQRGRLGGGGRGSAGDAERAPAAATSLVVTWS